MDFLDPKKKRAHRNKLFIGYGLMAVAIATATTILVYAANGYGINRQTGELIQNGLLFVNSQPVSANIFINGKDRGTTGARFVLPENDYEMELRADGYRTWKQNFGLEGNEVLRLAYPLLFPTNLVQTDIRPYEAAPDVVSASPDRQWLITHVPTAFNQFEVMQTGATTITPVAITVPETILIPRAGAQSLTAVEWSNDNRHVLLKHTYEGGQDFVVLDREQPLQSVNISQRYDRQFSDVRLRDMRFDRLYAYEQAGGLLQAAELGDNLTLTPVASDVLSFHTYQGNVVLYTTANSAPEGQVAVRLKDNTADYRLRFLPADTTHLLKIAEFDGQLYVAAGEQAGGNVFLYRNPFNALKSRQQIAPLSFQLLKVDGAAHVSFSSNARFFSVQGGSQFAVYDFEQETQLRYDTELPAEPTQKAEWMDGHRLVMTSQGKLFAFDFDGTNKQDLGAIVNGYKPVFNQDHTRLLRISPVADGTIALNQTELVVAE